MKRKLSLLMVLMMVLTLIPAMPSFAATESTVDTISTTEDAIVEDFSITIDTKATGITTPGVFELALSDNAEWLDDAPNGYAITSVEVTGSPASVTQADIYDSNKPLYVISDPAGKSIVQLRLKNIVPANKPGAIVIKGKVDLGGAEETEQKVTVRNVTTTGITQETKVYAVVEGSGDFLSRTLEGAKTRVRGTVTGAQFEVRESSNGVLGANKTATFKLPKDTKWDDAGTVVTFNDEPIAVTDTMLSDDGRLLTLNVSGTGDVDRITITPKVVLTKDAKLGEIKVTMGSTISDADALTIIKYVDYGVTAEVEEVKTIVAGNVEEDNDDQEVVITLDAASDSFNASRPIDFVVNGGSLKITKIDTSLNGIEAPGFISDENEDPNDDYMDEFSLTPLTASEDIEITAYLRADWDTVGDMTLSISGGVDKQDLVIAKVVAPVTVTTKAGNKAVADVVVGLQAQDAPEITLTETQAGSLQEGYYVLEAANNRYSAIEFVESKLDIDVDGDIEVDDIYVSEDDPSQLIVHIDGDSSEASTITVKGLQVTLDRSVPYGTVDYKLVAVIEDIDATNGNYGQIDPDMDPEDGIDNENKGTIVAKIPFLNVVTEVQTARQQKTVFTLDSATYTVGAETRTLDAAPYISNNRTMLPIGTVAQLAGATLNYSPSTRTAVFTKDNLVVSMNLDTNILLVNGSPVPMDAKPEIVNSRAFVPVVYVAQAFGIQNGIDIVYDAASRTVTLFPNAQ